jgi:hypothetical protein
MAMKSRRQTLLLFVLAVGAPHGYCQSLVYVEPGIAACPAVPAATAPKTVQRGAAVVGSLRVSCGFDQGSYTVTLNSSDPAASISPKTIIINFGRVVGPGKYTVRFSTLGLHSISAAITSNMGSPAVRGHFVNAGNEFQVVQP